MSTPQPGSAASHAVPARSWVGNAATYRHLYVAAGSFANPAVYRFALSPTGLPASTPDAVLTGIGLIAPFAVAFDKAGYIYVSDAEVDAVFVYPPGSTGSALPVRVISVPLQPLWLAVNSDGYIFVVEQSTVVDVFAPSDSSVKPLHVIIPPASELGGMILDSTGRLYVNSLFGQGVFRYDQPLAYWKSPSFTFSISNEQEGKNTIPLALDEEDQRVYFGVQPNLRGPRANSFAARPLYAGENALGHAIADPILRSDSCHVAHEITTVGMVVNHHYIIVSCAPFGALVVYKNRFGIQKPFEVIAPPGMSGPEGIAFGP